MSFGDGAIRYHPVFKDGANYYYVETVLETNELVHVVGAYDGNVAKLYINSRKVGEIECEVSAYIAEGKKVFFIGRDTFFEPHRYFKGTIHKVRIYPRALSDSEVLQTYLVDKHLFD